MLLRNWFFGFFGDVGRVCVLPRKNGRRHQKKPMFQGLDSCRRKSPMVWKNWFFLFFFVTSVIFAPQGLVFLVGLVTSAMGNLLCAGPPHEFFFVSSHPCHQRDSCLWSPTNGLRVGVPRDAFLEHHAPKNCCFVSTKRTFFLKARVSPLQNCHF